MKSPTGGPLLYFSFYCAAIPEAAALARVVAALLGTGAVFLSAACATLAGGQEEDTTSVADLMQWLGDPTRRVRIVALAGATDTTRKLAESVGYDHISAAATLSDHPAVAIETDGHWTEHWLQKGGERQARGIGRRARRRFCNLAEAIRPAYAAILAETYLPCPTDLRGGRPFTHFSNFFVSGAYVGTDRLSRIRALFHGAYVEPIADGLYISCYEFLNPSGVSLAWDDGRRSEQVAAIIASVHAPTRQTRSARWLQCPNAPPSA